MICSRLTPEANPDSLSPSPAANEPPQLPSANGNIPKSKNTQELPPFPEPPAGARSFSSQCLVVFPYQILYMSNRFWGLNPVGQILSSTYVFPFMKEYVYEPSLANLMVFVLPFSFILSISPLAPLTWVLIFSCNFMHVHFIMSSEYNHRPQPH